MKALTIWQPWAWAIAEGYKPIENRGWRPHWMLGKRFAIHAGMKYELAAVPQMISLGLTPPSPTGLFGGCIVAVAILDSIVTESDSPWFCGPYGLVLRDVVKIKPGVSVRGKQGFWDLPSNLAAEVEKRLLEARGKAA